MNEFTERYKTYTNQDLYRILDNKKDYQPLAVEAAKNELANRRLSKIEIIEIKNELRNAKEELLHEYREKEEKIKKLKKIENKFLKILLSILKLLKLNRQVSFSVRATEKDFLKHFELLVDTESILILDPFTLNTRKYKGNINAKNFVLKKLTKFFSIDSLFTSLTSIKGNYEVHKHDIIINTKIQLRDWFQIYIFVSCLIIFPYFLYVTNGWKFLILTIVVFYIVFLGSIIFTKQILVEDFSEFLNGEIK